MAESAWKKQPGECHDCRGVPIYPGDLLRTPHFRDSRRRKRYLYHVAVMYEGGMKMISVRDLEPTLAGHGGSAWLDDGLAADAEIIDGHGPDGCLSFHDRPRVKEVPK